MVSCDACRVGYTGGTGHLVSDATRRESRCDTHRRATDREWTRAPTHHAPQLAVLAAIWWPACEAGGCQCRANARGRTGRRGRVGHFVVEGVESNHSAHSKGAYTLGAAANRVQRASGGSSAAKETEEARAGHGVRGRRRHHCCCATRPRRRRFGVSLVGLRRARYNGEHKSTALLLLFSFFGFFRFDRTLLQGALRDWGLHWRTAHARMGGPTTREVFCRTEARDAVGGRCFGRQVWGAHRACGVATAWAAVGERGAGHERHEMNTSVTRCRRCCCLSIVGHQE